MRKFKRKTLSGVRLLIFATEMLVMENFVIFIKYLIRNNPQITYSDIYPSITKGLQGETRTYHE